MKQGTTNIQIIYKPLNTSVSTTFLSGNPKQTFDSDSDTFQPDRRIDPLTIKVNCLVSDTYGFVDGSVNASLTDISWKILDSNGVSTDILSTNKNYKIGTGAEKGQLRVFQNVDELAPITIVFTAAYLEPKSKRVAKFQESINLSTITSSATPLQLDTDMPMGGALYVTKDTDRLLARGRLFRGKDEVPASYYWYDANGNELTDTNGITGSKTKMISIPSTQISKSGSVVKLEVGDASDYYNSLLDEAVMNDAQVTEWIDSHENNTHNLFPNSKDERVYSNTALINVGTFELNTEYTISFDAKIVSGNPLFHVEFHGGINAKNFELTSNYVRYSHTINSNSEYAYLFFWLTASGEVSLKNIKLEKGNTATDWSPALEDINNLIAQKKKDYATLDKQVIEWQNLMYKYGENLFLKSKVGFYDGSSGEFINNGVKIYGVSGSLATVRVLDVFPENDIDYTISFEAYSNIDGADFILQVDDIDIAPISLRNFKNKYSFTFRKLNNEFNFIDLQDLKGFIYNIENIKLEKGNKATDWSPNLIDLNNLIASTSANPDIPVKLPDNYRPSTKPTKVYKGDFLLIKRYPSYTEEVLITQGGIDASSSSVEVEMVIKTNEGVLQNPENYFSVKWYKQSNGTYKYSGFKVNIAMEDIIALQSTGAELDYELTEIK